MGTAMSKRKYKTRISSGSTVQGSDIIKLTLALFFTAFVFFPLARMFLYMDWESLQSVLSSANLKTAIGNSLVSAILSTFITMVIAYVIAYYMERSRLIGRNLFGILFVLPMLIPSISHGMGIVLLFGNNGLLTRLFGADFHIYGLPGIVVGSVLYSFPIAYLMLSDVMRYEDSSPYEAARVLGIDRLHQFTAITLPYLRKPIISIIFAVFSVIITDYGVPLMVGGTYTTIPVIMYQEVIGRLNFSTGVSYGCFLLIPAIIAFVLDLLNRDGGNTSFVSKPFAPLDNPIGKVIGYCLFLLVGLFVLLPVVSFVLLGFAHNYPTDMSFTFANIAKAFNLKLGRYLGHSVTIALFVSFIGICIAFVNAYVTARMKTKATRFLYLAAVTSAAIPGLVLGLSYVLTFKNTPIYGTLLMLIIVNTVHFFSSPYLMMYNSLLKLNENLEGVGYTLGISRWLMIRDVIIPQCRQTLWEMFSYFFVNCMMTISAVSFLATTATKPASLMITQFEAQMQLECAAIVSLCILIINLLIKAIAHYFKKHSVLSRHI